MASLFSKWDPAILRPSPPHARNNMCVGWTGPDQRCKNQLPLDRVAAGRDLIHNLSTMYIYHIDYPNLRGGLGGTVSDCLCHLHGDQVQLVETKWMAIIKVEAKNAEGARFMLVDD
ncbi:hypothetical protein GRF29_8g125557 [Pseudopithomyces chartarum]|uniref:Uncharacterized protein n=1 Tax=Pseudopithomyces chartarum TaxID=1892770 RepID=A0AAN6M5T5_9PLEO|nr:hypothetical protein GRF29_8g125557 [Pseudopithomyces chartarum]